MLTLDEILDKADEITLELQENSITPARVGELLSSLTEQLRLLSGGGTVIGASKLSELKDVMFLNPKENDILQRIGTKWTNAALDLARINQLMSWFKLDADGNLYTELSLYSKKELSAYGAGTGGGGVGGGSVTVYNGLDSTDSLIALSANMGRVLNVTKLDVSAISAWAKATSKPTYGMGEISGLTAEFSKYSLATHAHAWNDITGKPTTFAPSAHNHLWADLSDKPTTFAPSEHVHSWGTITDKPVSFTPSTHAHAWNDITGKPTTFAPSAHNHLWADLSDKPTTFAPSAHDHSFASLTAKPTTLSGYGITDALLATAYTASDVFAKVLTQDGHGTGLDADTLDGKHCIPQSGAWWNNIAFVGGDGVMSIGKYIDFRELTTMGSAYSGRLQSNAGALLWNGNSIYHSANSNLTTIDWAAKNMTVQTDITLNGLTSTNKSLKTLLDKFDIDTNGNLIVKTNLYSVGDISAYQSGTGVSGLKLMGNLDANGKSITGALQIYGGNAYLGNVGINPSLQWSYEGDENTMAEYDVLTGEYFYAGNQVKYGYDRLEVVGQVKASEFKFGNYSFKQSANGLSICFNGVEQAYITSTGEYINL